MGVEDQPTVKHLRSQMDGLGVLLRINKLLRCFGLGSKEIAGLESRFMEIQGQLREYTEYPDRFNKIFAADGWLAHDSLNFDVLKQAVDTYFSHGKEQAAQILLTYYGPEQVADRAFLFNHATELSVRRRFIDFALTENAAGRHYSAVPLLLMVIDGAVNDAFGKGFHTSGLSLDVWDSLMAADGAIYNIKEIFQRGRKKTRIESIEMPFRNGILHGMDLGYDNPIVTAKCWCFLFVVRDWILAKKSESTRREAYQRKIHVPNLRELATQFSSTNRLRAASDAWEPRQIDAAYLNSLIDSGAAEEGTPEVVVLHCLAFWKRRNYAGMAQLFLSRVLGSARAIREQFGDTNVESYSLRRIVDAAPVIAEVDAETNSGAAIWTFRLIREDKNGNPVPANLAGGHWQIVWIRRMGEDASADH